MELEAPTVSLMPDQERIGSSSKLHLGRSLVSGQHSAVEAVPGNQACLIERQECD